MKKVSVLKLFSLAAFAAAGALGLANAKSVKKAEKLGAANGEWESISLYYAASTQIDGKIAVRRGDTVPGGSSVWEDENMSYTNRQFGSKYVYETTVWEYYGGFNDIYFKNGDTVLKHISNWTTRDTMNGKLFTHTSDSDNEGSWKTVFTVDFDMNSYGGTAPGGLFVENGGKITKPTDPVMAGHDFLGWYKEPACTNAWNFTTDTVSADTILYAKFDVQKFTVTKYKVLDGAAPVSIGTEEVASGASYAVPASRYEEGYTFGGWFSDAACNTAYTAHAITADTPIYAKYTSGSWSGTIHVDLGDSQWYEAAAYYAVYFMDKTTYSEEISGWSSLVTTAAEGNYLVEVPYSLGFAPLEMIVVRYNPAKTDWETSKWTDLWGQTPDITFGEVVRIKDTLTEKKNNADVGLPKVMLWGPDAQVNLNSIKMNDSHHVEYYSNSVAIEKDQEFKIQVAPYTDDDYLATYSTYSSITSNFQVDGTSGNIVCKVAGTYAFYFDSQTKSLYITQVDVAAADEWAQNFLGADCAASKSGWSASSTAYGLLSDGAKTILSGQEHKDHLVEVSSFVERAVQRYDYIIERYGVDPYNDFMGRITAGKVTPGSAASLDVGYNTPDSNNLIVIVSIVSLVSASTLIGLIVIKRRRGIAK